MKKYNNEVNEINNAITKRVLNFMQKKDYTKYEIGKKLGMPNATLYSLLNGKLNWSLEFLLQFSNGLNIDLSYLLFGESDNALLTQLRKKISELEVENEKLKRIEVKLDKVKKILIEKDNSE
jgi:transcriptional regulator with XRE-family HTH domain